VAETLFIFIIVVSLCSAFNKLLPFCLFCITRLVSEHAYSGFYLSVLAGVLRASHKKSGWKLYTGRPENALRYPTDVYSGKTATNPFPSIPIRSQPQGMVTYLWADTSHQSSTYFCVYLFLLFFVLFYQNNTAGQRNGFCLDTPSLEYFLVPELNPNTQTEAVCRPMVGGAF
jgi:hypothetical protein